MTARPAIVTRGLVMAFGGLHAVDGVDLEIPAGQRRVVIGPNGAGKTTLFNLIAGQLRPTAGSVALLGTDVTALPSHRRARAGLARTFQITNLLATLTVLDNVLLAVAAGRRATRRNFARALRRSTPVVRRAEELLGQWDLWDLRDRTVSELAYGQQRVLEIVLSLAGDPQVLLLDEPTAGLSSADATRMTQITAALPRSLTLLLIEHDMDVAFALGDRVTVLVNGRELASGTPEEIQGNQQVVEAYLGGHRAA